MEYLFIIAFQIVGILCHVAQKIVQFDRASPEKTRKEIVDLFFENEWSSLASSGVFLFLHLLIHGASDYYNWLNGTEFIALFGLMIPMTALSLGIALVIGYAGQRIVYKYLGNMEAVLNKTADKIQ
jgi:ABC-type Fe3+ transport system permease subunit